jgi:DUF4097 and DUF4098 domain-containing protein YvlB
MSCKTKNEENQMKTLVGLTLFCTVLLLAACESVGPQRYSEEVERTFNVGEAPSLYVDNFGGTITVRTGDAGVIHVIATKRAAQEDHLADIEIEFADQAGGIVIDTLRPSSPANLSVQFDITAPADTSLDLRTGGGDIDVRGVTADVRVETGGGSVQVQDGARVDAHTGGGDIEIRDVTGPIAVNTGGGSIDVRGDATGIDLQTGGGDIAYEGRPQGDSHFETGGGSIDIRVPGDISARVDLSTGGGDVSVDWPVQGQVEKADVKGSIGGGDGGTIYAHTGGGDINVRKQ